MIEIQPIGYVRATRTEVKDDHWGGAQSRIELAPEFDASALDGIDAFSHVEVIFHFHLADPARIETRARHPRNNPKWPKIGIFAQRGKNRPNLIGTCIAKLVRREPRALVVAELDAIDGTPVLDVKPYLEEFAPRGEVHQPAWSHELMRAYW